MPSNQLPSGHSRAPHPAAPERAVPPRHLILPLLIVLVGAAASLWMYQVKLDEVAKRESTFFSERVAEAQAGIETRVTHYLDALHGGASYFNSTARLDHSWRLYAESLDLRRRYPGVNGMGIILAVPPSGVEAWRARVAAAGEAPPEFRPFPGTQAGPADDVKYLITVVETAPGERAPIGRDIATEPSRRRAAETARDTGRPFINQRIPGSRDTQRRAGLLLYVPLYRPGLPLASVAERRAAHVGWVYAQVFPEVFLAGVMAPMSDKLRLHFFEAGELSRDRLLYASDPSAGAELPAFEQVTELTLAGQPFRLGWTRGPSFPPLGRAGVPLVPATMSLATLLLAGLVISLQTASRRAHAMVDARTAELAASEERFRQAFDFAGIGMALVGLDGQFTRVNPAFCEIIGYPAGRLLQKKFQEITHPDDLAADIALLDELIAGKRRSYQLEKRYLHRDGHSVWIRLTVSLVRDTDGRPQHAIAQIEDIAERKRLEATLAKARDQALAEARSRTDFLATIIHQIRTPANELVGTVARLRNRLVDPQQLELVNALDTSGDAFLKVLSNILEYWNLEFNTIEFAHEVFNLRECVAGAIEKHAASAQEKRVRLESALAASAPTWVAGDAKRLGQILSSLLESAIRFTDAGEVRLTLAAEPLDAATGRQRLKFAVRDTGSGIAANSAFRSGVAIELAISKRLTELMGGMFWTESELGRGTIFHFTVAVEPRDTHDAE